MAYTTDATLFAAQVTGLASVAPPESKWVGIGAYQLTADQIVANVQTARRAGVRGIVLFSYDSLAAPDRPAGVAAVGRAAFVE